MTTMLPKWIAVLGLVATAWAYSSPTINFKDSGTRYLSGHDLFRVLIQKLPDAKWDDECSRLTESNRPIVGDANPFNGEMTYRTPSAAFVKWYVSCVSKGLESQTELSLKNGHFPMFFGKKAVDALNSKGLSQVVSAPKQQSWESIPPEIQRHIVGNLVARFIGPEVVSDETALLDVLLGSVKSSKLNTFEAIKKLSFFILTSDEFLTY